MDSLITEHLINIFMSDRSLYDSTLALVREYTDLAPSADEVINGMEESLYVRYRVSEEIRDMVETFIDEAGNTQDFSRQMTAPDNCIIQCFVRYAFGMVNFNTVAQRFIDNVKELGSQPEFE
jgi:hypothetical protein